MSRLKINENGRLYWEEVRGALYIPANLPDVHIDSSQQEQLKKEIYRNSGRPVEAWRYLPRRWHKNKMGIS